MARYQLVTVSLMTKMADLLLAGLELDLDGLDNIGDTITNSNDYGVSGKWPPAIVA